MSVLSGKKILLGVTGGIAAYKTAFLVRLFVKEGAEVKVVMTPDSKDFVTPLTLAALSKNKVYTAFTEEEKDRWNNHVELAKWADLMVIAPATARTISKIADGLVDNFLMAVYLSVDCPVYVAPAMDLDMYQHPTTHENLAKLESFGHKIVPAESGELASGLVGQGRMAEPENIVAFVNEDLKKHLRLNGKKILITAGPTYEAIDPVRFIGNHSSGKMGYALAEVAARDGAKVILVSGPSVLKAVHPNIQTIRVTSADEMYEAVHQHYKSTDVVIAAAAVADYKPETVADQKIKKTGDDMTIKLVKTKDILLSLGQTKTHQLLVGFALETENEIENAQSKLEKKNLDFIVLNSLAEEGAGFKTDTNRIRIIRKDEVKSFELKSKMDVAKDIVDEIGIELKLNRQ